MTHTPEPWVTGERQDHCIYTPDRKVRIVTCETIFLDFTIREANADRIVACVNACAGMDDPAAEIAALKRQSAELLNALEKCEASFRMHRTGGYRLDYKGNPAHEDGSPYLATLQAIAKVKEGKP